MKYLHHRGAAKCTICAILASCFLSGQAFAQPTTLLTPEPASTPEQQLNRGQENLKAIKAQLQRFTRTQLTDDTVMILEPNALKIRSQFRDGLIRTEFKAEKNGDLLFRIRVPF